MITRICYATNLKLKLHYVWNRGYKAAKAIDSYTVKIFHAHNVSNNVPSKKQI